MPNQLIKENSPYLLQHANNPVDWYTWGDEALKRAKCEDKPILLSVGYSACHWCHVMEKESFENADIAAFMNQNFVCIKVDREERPDIDSIYMAAVQSLTGRGGWPMTVFLTPDAIPYYGGTYFPPEDRGGLPGFSRVLQTMSDAYQKDRGQVILSGKRLLQHMQHTMNISGEAITDESLMPAILGKAFEGLVKQFDSEYGGFGTQPKFPQPMTYEFLLRYHLRSNDPKALSMVELTLDRMAYGGIYDQLGGGFHRYSTDMYWLVPHFEKMLYDNALLVKLYLHTYQVVRKPLYRRVVEETLDYVLREMRDPSGGFYSAQDADTEGVEGKYFVWRPEAIINTLGEENGRLFNDHFGVTNVGNFDGMSILNVSDAFIDSAPAEVPYPTQDSKIIDQCRVKLFEERCRRIKPGIDDKVLTSWNGLMLGAFAEAGAILDRKDYIEAAVSNAELLLSELLVEGRLLRTHKDGISKLYGYLEDYSFTISGLISLHEATLDERWLKSAIDLGNSMVDLFWDNDSHQFFDTGTDHEQLLIRPREITDNAIPSGSSMAVDVMLRLAEITGDSQFRTRASQAFHSVIEFMGRFPTGSGHWLAALDFYLSEVDEIALIGNKQQESTKIFAKELHSRYNPHRILVGMDAEGESFSDLPLMKDKKMIDGLPTVYICRNYVCQLPTNDLEKFKKMLAVNNA